MSADGVVVEGRLRAVRTMWKPGPHKLLGKHRRVRSVSHGDGLVRVALRRPQGRCRFNSASWVVMGDFSEEQSQRLLHVLVPLLDDLCDQLGMKPDIPGMELDSVEGDESSGEHHSVQP